MASWNQLIADAINDRPDSNKIRELAETAPDRIRFTRAFGHGSFKCPGGHKWSSHRVCVTFDIRRECVAKVWMQFCEKCPNNGARPDIKAAEQVQMVTRAVENFYLKAVAAKDNTIESARASGNSNDKPHRVNLCEACRVGKCVNNTVVDLTSRLLEQLTL
ncbi:receptor-transporting protein 2-like [Tropilaelaps mercedesae]|uniref:Receptor-transporting protein 2-like n=1 Tax=Tropilaelaps mercedesae TaxID=418985 RepID=A0A1V9X2Z4_9ACAR|nr:receptor-transporting protein 2-like [Tropilaelaps mercedesae]